MTFIYDARIQTKVIAPIVSHNDDFVSNCG